MGKRASDFLRYVLFCCFIGALAAILFLAREAWAAEKVVVALDRSDGIGSFMNYGLAYLDLDLGIFWELRFPSAIDVQPRAVWQDGEGVIHVSQQEDGSTTWLETKWDSLTGNYIGSVQHGGHAPGREAPVPGSNWVLTPADGFVAPSVPGTYLVALKTTNGTIQESDPFANRRVGRWRWSSFVNGAIGASVNLYGPLANSLPSDPVWINIVRSGATPPNVSRGWPQGMNLAGTEAIAEMPSNASPSGIVWLFAGSYGLYAAFCAQSPISTWNLVPAAASDAYRDVADAPEGAFALGWRSIERIEPLSLAAAWDTPLGAFSGLGPGIVLVGEPELGRIAVPMIFPPAIVSVSRNYGMILSRVELDSNALAITEVH